MYPILFATAASFAFGAVAGVVITWTVSAYRIRAHGPRGGEHVTSWKCDATTANVVALTRRAA